MTPLKHSKLIPALALVLTLAFPALAQPPPLPPVPPGLQSPSPLPPASAPAAGVEEPRIEESFAIPEGLTPANRDPFWPIGYVPKSADELEAERTRSSSGANRAGKPRWTEARESLRIGGYMKGPKGYTALVNNGLLNPGELVSHVFEGILYRWKVDAISSRGISFVPLDWVPADGSLPKPGKDRP